MAYNTNSRASLFPTGNVSIADLGITDGTSGDVLTTNGSGVFSFATPSYFSGSFVDLTNKPDTISGYGITDAFSGSYSDLTNKPTIPTNNNQLTNGANYITGYTVTQDDVTAHQTALSITQSQITDLSLALNDLSDIDTSSATTNQVLTKTASGISFEDVQAPPGLTALTKTASYTLAAADSGRLIITNSNVTLPASTFTAGNVISITNNGTSSITLTSSAVDLYIIGTTIAQTSITLSPRGYASIVCVGTDEFIISGGGIS